jgi:FHA domain/Cysteine-rich secretory protein family
VARSTQGTASSISGQPGEQFCLVAIASSPRREYPIDRPRIAIGSHPSNDVVVDDSTVSRYHAAITRGREGFDLADLSSTNGTFVNGNRVRKSVALKRGDEIKFGAVRFAFINAGDSAAATSLSPRVDSGLMWGLATLLALFVAGFAGVRYRNQIGAAVSAIASRISSRQVNQVNEVPGPAPSAINTQSIAANPEMTVSPKIEPKMEPTPERELAPGAPQPEWLKRVNYYRAMVKLPPIVEDAEASKGDREHAMYIVRNYRELIFRNGLGAEMHTEDPESPGFTPEGLEAAKSSDMDVWTNRGEPADSIWGSPDWSIDGWMALPFHRMPILNPALTSAGFGMDCERGACAAGLNLLKGSQRKPSPEAAASLPIEFPPDGGTVSMYSFENEWPEPRTSCSGFTAPSGLTITLQLGTWMDTHLGEYSVSRVNPDGSNTQIDACGFDSTSYSNPDAYSQDLGRNVLKSYGTVVVIPRAPLDKGAKYTVSIKANGKQYDWTFSTTP